MSLESRSGVVVTKPLVFEGPEVVLNAKGEKVKVCAKDLSGKIRGIAKFSGDSTREVLKWDRPLPTGTPVRLQFELTHAALYSIEVKRLKD